MISVTTPHCALLLVLSLSLAGCGQTGELRLPEAQASPAATAHSHTSPGTSEAQEK